MREDQLVTATQWSESELAAVDEADELRIAVRRTNGSLRPPVPIWVATVDGQLYVRTWQRRDTGWFGRVLSSRRARISVGEAGGEVVADVVVDDVGSTDRALRDGVDAAYRAKYQRYGQGSVDRMVGDDAAAATLKLTRDSEG